MMCDKCGKNPATTHIRRVINGAVYEAKLCAYCAAKEGYGNSFNLSLSNMLASMLDEGFETAGNKDRRCECCGASFSDIAESGRVGCSQCYETFERELEPSLNRLHGKVQHIGKMPETATKTETREEKIKKLKTEMANAIETEDFEKAALCRDEIKALEGETKNNE